MVVISMKKSLSVIALLLAACSPVAAQHFQAQNQEAPKSVLRGRSIALTNTILSIATGMAAVSFFDNKTLQTGGAVLTTYGLVMGPSTGNFYGDDYRRGLLGAAGRAAGLYLLADATREVLGDPFADVLGVDDTEVTLTDTKVLTGGILVISSTLYNVISVSQSVWEYEEERTVSMGMNTAVIENKVTPMITAHFHF